MLSKEPKFRTFIVDVDSNSHQLLFESVQVH